MREAAAVTLAAAILGALAVAAGYGLGSRHTEPRSLVAVGCAPAALNVERRL